MLSGHELHSFPDAHKVTKLSYKTSCIKNHGSGAEDRIQF